MLMAVLMSGMIRNNYIERSDFKAMKFLKVSEYIEDITVAVHDESRTPTINSTSSELAVSSWTFTTSSNRTILVGSSDDKVELQYYLLGVYAFFALLFAIAIILIVVKKINKACSRSHKLDHGDYESVPHNSNLNPRDNLAFEHHINGDYLDVERVPVYDSDYDYYSDEEAITEHLKDKPPAYEDPPSYDTSLPKPN